MTTNLERLRIKNFAGIQEADIEVSRMNVFIGPQASGKSVCAKLLFFFKEAIRRLPIHIVNEETKAQIRTYQLDLFRSYFPSTSWGQNPFEIEYVYGSLSFKVYLRGNEPSTLQAAYSSFWDSLLRLGRKALKEAETQEDDDLGEDNLSTVYLSLDQALMLGLGQAAANQSNFIPAGRSFFSTIQSSVFSFIAENIDIDPFIAQFGRLYESTRRTYKSATTIVNRKHPKIDEQISKLICGRYTRSGGRDFINTDDGRLVSLENSSSGQQEILPLALLIRRLAGTKNGMSRTSLFVEEPEAHLYPNAQREVVHLLSAATDLTSDGNYSQYIITTHSPYILSAMNNLMYGEQIARSKPQSRDRVARILGETRMIDAANVRAYEFGNGRVKSVIDAETQLIDAAVLDEVSNELAGEFSKLVDIAYEEQVA